MSDNIPIEIQLEIIKKVSDVKSLIQFRSVSKTWKSFIDSSEFINGYSDRHTQRHNSILRYEINRASRYVCLIDDDNDETFKLQQQQQEFVVSPLLTQFLVSYVVGTCHGLLCAYGCYDSYRKWMVVIWNPSIRKSFGITLPVFQCVFGFGVCPVTRDPTVVKILQKRDKPCHVEVFTLSSGVWKELPSSNLPPQSVRLNRSTQVVIDRFIYWGAYNDIHYITSNTVVSFDLITKKFKVVDLPDSLTNKVFSPVFVSKLRESLVVYGHIMVKGAPCCDVWVMEHDSSFKRLFTIGARVDKLMGFKKNGETIFETGREGKIYTTLDVYDPCSQQIKNLGISGLEGSFFMGSYKESLLLLDHSDLHIYSNDN